MTRTGDGMACATRTDEYTGAAPVISLGAIAFETAPLRPVLDDDIHLWLHETGATHPRETRRRSRFVLDELLRAYAGVPVNVQVGEHGKPVAADHPWLDFNLSHAGSTVVFAFARSQALGVDIECRGRRLAIGGIARRFFAAEEAAALARLADSRRSEAFIDLWTCKEAVLKARGDGLSFGLDRVEFTVGAAGGVASLARFDGEAASRWRVIRFDPAPCLAGCLAWNGASRDLKLYRVGA